MTKNCDMWIYNRTGPPHTRCKKHARVMVQLKLEKTYGDVPTKQTLLRCWQHYLEIEERARQPNAGFTIIGAVLYGPNEQREAANVAQS